MEKLFDKQLKMNEKKKMCPNLAEQEIREILIRDIVSVISIIVEVITSFPRALTRVKNVEN
jgi:hypothetical protein